MTQPDKKIVDDLDYLSDIGYETFPNAEADVVGLKKRIRKSYSHYSNFNSYFFTLMIGVFIGVTLFFTIYNSPTLFPSYTEKQKTENKINDPLYVHIDTVTIFPSKTTIKPLEHDKFREHIDTVSIGTTEQAEMLEPINSIDLENMNSLADNTLKYSPNAPIIYLHDLKIANYHINYFNSQKNIVVPSGIPAAYSDKNELTGQGKQLDRNYYLHMAIDDAMRLFKKQKYKECISLLNTISKFNPNDINCLFYKGMSFYYLKNYKEAYSNFKLAQANEINVFKEETDYYLALSALKIGKKDEALQLLNDIISGKGFYSQKAIEIKLHS